MTKGLYDRTTDSFKLEGLLLIEESVYVHTACNIFLNIKGPKTLFKYVFRKIEDYLRDGFRD